MAVGHPAILQAVQSFLDRQKLKYEVKDEQWCTKLTVNGGVRHVPVSVFNTGKIVIGGSNSP